MSLLSRVLLLVTAVVLVVLALIGVLVVSSLETYYLREREVALLSQASVIGGLALETLRDGPPATEGRLRLERIAADYGRQLGVRVLILDAGGTVLADTFSDPKMLGVQLKHPEVLSAASGQAVAAPHNVEDSGWVMYATSPVFSVKQVVGMVFLSASINDVYRSLIEVARRLAYVGALGFVVAVAVSYLLVHSLTRPIARLSSAARKIAQGDFGVRVPARGGSELARLGRDFNTMAERLDKLEEARRTFVANASHELKTPVSSLRALVEPLVGEHSGEVDDALRREFLSDIAGEVDRLDRLAGDLLDLARLDETDELRLQPLKLEDLVLEAEERMRPVAARAGVRLVADCRPVHPVRVDELRFSQAVHNLVDNAVKFTPPGGTVTLRTRSERGDTLVEVIDTGLGIPPAELAHVFDRFYRVDPARSREKGGTGLGLAIARRIVQLHGGEIDVQSEPGEGSTFRIRLGPPAH